MHMALAFDDDFTIFIFSVTALTGAQDRTPFPPESQTLRLHWKTSSTAEVCGQECGARC